MLANQSGCRTQKNSKKTGNLTRQLGEHLLWNIISGWYHISSLLCYIFENIATHYTDLANKAWMKVSWCRIQKILWLSMHTNRQLTTRILSTYPLLCYIFRKIDNPYASSVNKAWMKVRECRISKILWLLVCIQIGNRLLTIHDQPLFLFFNFLLLN